MVLSGTLGSLYPPCYRSEDTLRDEMDEATFVVRIYRKARLAASMLRAGAGRRGYDKVALFGVAEDVEGGERQAFHDIEELWAILARTEDGRSKPGSKKRR